jgi:L-ascorbate metabolism protein UlaG (beta-lactamase superfamily)
MPLRLPHSFPHVVALIAALFATPSGAADESAPGCIPPVARAAPRIMLAAVTPKPGPEELAITFVGHATFLIESPGGIRVATDYNDYIRPAVTPEIATMNRAHSTHNSTRPDPGIAHLLRGWNPAGGVARHDVSMGDMRVRNVPTNIREWGGSGTDYGGNSIFIMEAAGLCVAHLGHLHHTLNPDQLIRMGKIDVLLVPVDGTWTLDLDGMVEVIESIGPTVVIPMHYFGTATLERFLAKMSEKHDIVREERPSIVVSRTSLPARPTVRVLPGR